MVDENTLSSLTTRVVTLARRPGVRLIPGDLRVTELQVAPPAEGQVTLRTILASVDSYQLNLLRGKNLTRSRVGIGDTVLSDVVGEVIESRDPRAPVGSLVAAYSGWREFATVTLRDTQILDRALGGPAEWVSVLSGPGVTAYMGLHDVGGIKADDTVLVTSAAGAVGGAAVQIAKAAGAYVVAVAGGPARAAHARDDLGADVALDYLASDFESRLRSASEARGGFDLFFDGVGGRQLALGVSLLANHGTAVLCGAVSSYAAGADPEARVDLTNVSSRRINIRGFVAVDHYERHPAIKAAIGALIREGKVKPVLSEFSGLDSAEEALAGLFESGTPSFGKRVLALNTQ